DILRIQNNTIIMVTPVSLLCTILHLLQLVLLAPVTYTDNNNRQVRYFDICIDPHVLEKRSWQHNPTTRKEKLELAKANVYRMIPKLCGKCVVYAHKD